MTPVVYIAVYLTSFIIGAATVFAVAGAAMWLMDKWRERRTDR